MSTRKKKASRRPTVFKASEFVDAPTPGYLVVVFERGAIIESDIFGAYEDACKAAQRELDSIVKESKGPFAGVPNRNVAVYELRLATGVSLSLTPTDIATLSDNG